MTLSRHSLPHLRQLRPVALACCALVGLAVGGLAMAQKTAAVAKPWNAIALVGFLVAMFWHAQLGLQVVLEDYIHNSLMALALQTTVKFVAVLGAIVSIFAVARVALGN